LRPAKAEITAEPPKPRIAGPFHAGLSPEGLGAINAARLSGPNGTDQALKPVVQITAAAAYQSSRTAL